MERPVPSARLGVALQHRWIAVTIGIVIIAAAAACNSTTSRLSAADEQRFAAEGIVRKADDIRFRYTHETGRGDARWEDRRASIIVTAKSLLIHKNEKVGLEINARTRRYIDVVRDREHIRIGVGSGRSREVWSFEPSSDAAGWAEAIRAVAKASKSSANR
jgi:hypothetical protein